MSESEALGKEPSGANQKSRSPDRQVCNPHEGAKRAQDAQDQPVEIDPMRTSAGWLAGELRPPR
jgi:hypothetical protein